MTQPTPVLHPAFPLAPFLNAGWLELFLGPMFSGKSKLLIDDFTLCRSTHPTVPLVCFSSSGQDHIFSRFYPDIIIPARPISELHNFLKEDFPSETFLFIDEVQMITSEDFLLLLELVRRGYTIRAYGLDLTYTGEPFAMVPLLRKCANIINTMTDASCTICSEPATHTQRLLDRKPVDTIGELIVLDKAHGGQSEYTYEARCRQHFVAPR